MDRQRCLMNPEHMGVFLCGCTVPPASLCAQCLADHMASPGVHNIASVRMQAMPPRVPPPGAFVCQMCNQQCADEFCCCRFPVVLLCKGCQLSHFQKGVGEAHLFMPAEFKNKMTSVEEVARLRQYLFNLSDAKGRLMAVFTHISQCQETMKSRLDRFINDFSDHVHKQVEELEALKRVLAAEIEKAVEKTREQILQQQVAGEDLTAILWKSARGVMQMNAELFEYQAPDSCADFDHLLSITWRSRIDLSGKFSDQFTYRNYLSRKLETAQSLLTHSFPSLTDLTSACSQAFESLITDERVMADTTERVAVKFYQTQYRCLQARDDILSTADPDYTIGKEVWIGRLAYSLREKCSGIEKEVVDECVLGLQNIAGKLYDKGDIPLLNGAHARAEGAPDAANEERIAMLERLVADIRSKLVDVVSKAEQVAQDNRAIRGEAEVHKQSLRDVQDRLETVPQRSEMDARVSELGDRVSAAEGRLSDMSANCAAGIENVRKGVEELQAAAKVDLAPLEHSFDGKLQKVAKLIEAEKTARIDDKTVLENQIRGIEKTFGKGNVQPAIEESLAKVTRDFTSLSKAADDLKHESDTHCKSIEQLKYDITHSTQVSDLRCRADMKNGRGYADIEEIETFLTAVIAQDKTDFQKKIQALRQELQRSNRLWALCGDLMCAISRTAVSEEVVSEYEGLFQRLLSEKDTTEAAFYLSKNLADYIRNSPVSVRTDEMVVKVLVALGRCSFDTEELKNSESLSHILTRSVPLPIDLPELLEDPRSYDPKPLLAEVRTDHIRTFSCASQTWSKKIVLNSAIRVDHRSSSVFLPSGHVMVCGGLAGSEWLADVYDIDPLSGVVVQLKSMNSKRVRLGLTAYYNSVYVFGGWAGSPLRSWERYSLAKNTWEAPSSEMLTARDYFTPCVYRHEVYLCGGSTTADCEKMDLATSRFSPLWFALPEVSFNRAIIVNNELVVITETKVIKRSLVNEKLYEELPHPSYRTNGSMSPVSLGGSLWCLSHSPSGLVVCISSATGELQRECPYPS